MKSWKTSVLGITAIVTAIGNAIPLLLDNNPATNPDWGSLIAIVSAGVMGLFARDNNVSSEQAGVK